MRVTLSDWRAFFLRGPAHGYVLPSVALQYERKPGRAAETYSALDRIGLTTRLTFTPDDRMMRAIYDAHQQVVDTNQKFKRWTSFYTRDGEMVVAFQRAEDAAMFQMLL